MKENKNILKYIIDRWILIVFAIIVVYFFIGIVLRGIIKNHLINSSPTTTTAVIVDEVNYWGNSPVSHTFSYSYEYIVDENIYRVDSRNENLKIGDSVIIEFVNFYPKFSRVVKNK
jgi:hypothetical protein